MVQRRGAVEAMVSGDFWRGKRVMVTGHTGFKGAWLCSWLNALGARLTGFSLAPETNPNLFALCGLESEMDSHLADVRDLAAVQTAFEGARPDIVFHLAAQSLVRRSIREPIATYATNVMGTVNVLEAVRSSHTVAACVIVTSDKCYENTNEHKAFVESDPLGGDDPYSSSKAAAELATNAYRATYSDGSNAAIASARAGNVIGGGDWAQERLMPDIVAAMQAGEAVRLRQPQSTRPWQHVLDPLSGYLVLAQRLIDAPREFANAWNFGPSEPAMTVSQVAEKAAACWPGHSKAAWIPDPQAQPKEAHELQIDPGRARADLGWRTKLSQTNAIEWTISWYERFHAGRDARELTLQQIAEYEDLP